MCQTCIDRDNEIKKHAEEFYARAGNNLDNALYDIYSLYSKFSDSLGTAYKMKMHLYKLYAPEKYEEEMNKSYEAFKRSIFKI